MSLYKITVKMSKRAEGMLIEPGMIVQLATTIPNPVSHIQEREKINTIFKNNFGVDLKKMGALNPAYLKEERIG